MKKHAILTYMSKGMMFGSAPSESGAARLNEGEQNSLSKMSDGTAGDLIRSEDGSIMKFNTQVHALNYCIENGWELEQTIFEPHDGFNARDPLSVFIFILSKQQ
mgnify:CR=1 FL=1